MKLCQVLTFRHWLTVIWLTLIHCPMSAESKVILRLPVCVFFYCDLSAAFLMSVLFSCVFNCLFFSRSSVSCFPNPFWIFTFSIWSIGLPMTTAPWLKRHTRPLYDPLTHCSGIRRPARMGSADPDRVSVRDPVPHQTKHWQDNPHSIKPHWLSQWYSSSKKGRRKPMLWDHSLGAVTPRLG